MRARHPRIRAGFALFTAALILAIAGFGRGATSQADAASFQLAASQPVLESTYQGVSAKDMVNRAGRVGPAQFVTAFVKINEQSLASYDGHIAGLAATSPAVTGAAKLDVNSAASRAYLAYLNGKLRETEARLRAAIPSLQVRSDLTVVLGGLVVSIDADDIAAAGRVPGVEFATRDDLRTLTTESTPAFTGATAVWEDLGGQESAGEGVVVGVLDTGIWPEHPSVSDPDPSGKPYAPSAPLGPGSCQFGSASPGDAPFTCNNKLIGARRFMDTYDAVIGIGPGEFNSARDDDGHGTHTATTAAGNGGVNSAIFGTARGTISGMAPRAKVIAYKVCGLEGCFGSDSAAAIAQAIIDGVNSINFSISGGANPYTDITEQAFLDAYNAGVFVAASAGNAGPGLDTTDHRGPWVTTVAASSGSRRFSSNLSLTASGGATLNLTGDTITAGLPSTAVYLPADPTCTAPIPAAAAGKIVVCARVGARVAKSLNAFNAGAAGLILYNVNQGMDLMTDNHWVPTVHITQADGAALVAWLAGKTGLQASFTQGAPSAQLADRITNFSSRGGPGQSLGVSKPDVTAPGIQILAGQTPANADPLTGPNGQLFQAIAGTSMSSPHVAGAGALLKALHPAWTPGQIKSALMTTAAQGVLKSDGVTPADAFDTGSGRIDLSKAGNPTLTISDTGANFVAKRNNLWDANYPSVYIPVMAGQVTISRTVHSDFNFRSQWEIRGLNLGGRTLGRDFTITSPTGAGISVPANGDATFQLTIDARNVPIGETRFAIITLKKDRTELNIPVTFVRREATVAVTKACAPATLHFNQLGTCTITATNNTLDPANIQMKDVVPLPLRVQAGTLTGGATQGGQFSNTVTANATLAGGTPPDVSVAYAPGSSPAGGYLPLALFGIGPIAGVGDETIVNFNAAPFKFGSETYTRIGITSNGYAVVGGGTGADVDFINQSLPNGARPNNVLAPFWTDLNPGAPAGGALRIGTLTDGVTSWLVLEWTAVKEFSSANTATFQIWIQLGATEGAWFTYGTVTGSGDGGFLTVGAENRFGNRGDMVYLDGAGTLPADGDEIEVTTTAPTPGETKTWTFGVKATARANVTNYAEVTGDVFAGTAIASAPISIIP